MTTGAIIFILLVCFVLSVGPRGGSKTITDCRECEHCEIAEYLPDDKISFSCLVMEIATDQCEKFKKGTPKEVEWINV